MKQDSEGVLMHKIESHKHIHEGAFDVNLSVLLGEHIHESDELQVLTWKGKEYILNG